eukprot:c15041_g1_i1.p1 GENE.c15041_g1_i1~~c15041_g1_i1.p1  ORF type:complete len:539 (+),score=59.98 c15041_g1_i1:191-1618(+)
MNQVSSKQSTKPLASPTISKPNRGSISPTSPPSHLAPSPGSSARCRSATPPTKYCPVASPALGPRSSTTQAPRIPRVAATRPHRSVSPNKTSPVGTVRRAEKIDRQPQLPKARSSLPRLTRMSPSTPPPRSRIKSLPSPQAVSMTFEEARPNPQPVAEENLPSAKSPNQRSLLSKLRHRAERTSNNSSDNISGVPHRARLPQRHSTTAASQDLSRLRAQQQPTPANTPALHPPVFPRNHANAPGQRRSASVDTKTTSSNLGVPPLQILRMQLSSDHATPSAQVVIQEPGAPPLTPRLMKVSMDDMDDEDIDRIAQQAVDTLARRQYERVRNQNNQLQREIQDAEHRRRVAEHESFELQQVLGPLSPDSKLYFQARLRREQAHNEGLRTTYNQTIQRLTRQLKEEKIMRDGDARRLAEKERLCVALKRELSEAKRECVRLRQTLEQVQKKAVMVGRQAESPSITRTTKMSYRFSSG